MVVILGMTGLIIIWARDGNLRLIAHPIHNIAAFVGIIAVMVHAYLGSLANPGTLRGIFEGKDKIQPHCVPVFEASYNPKQKDKFSKKS